MPSTAAIVEKAQQLPGRDKHRLDFNVNMSSALLFNPARQFKKGSQPSNNTEL
jgi:hypothetical protein